jgi:hypothetical protein
MKLMREHKQNNGRVFQITLMAGLMLFVLSSLSPLHSAKKETPVHGVCWMGGNGNNNCKAAYVDLGPVNKNGSKPVWVFPADGDNPFDISGNYSPARLQNNVFGGGGRIWPMYIVVSGNTNLYATTDGNVTIRSTVWFTDGRPSRDLTFNPVTSEDELLALEASGDVVITFTGLNIDCPMTAPDEGDIVVDLNPDVSTFCHKSK